MAKIAPISIQDSNFNTQVLESEQPVLVDFWAEWCGPCRAIAPLLNDLAEDFSDRIAIKKINVDENKEYTAKFGIRSIPTMLVFKQGEVVDTLVGVQSRKQLVEVIEKHS